MCVCVFIKLHITALVYLVCVCGFPPKNTLKNNEKVSFLSLAIFYFSHVLNALRRIIIVIYQKQDKICDRAEFKRRKLLISLKNKRLNKKYDYYEVLRTYLVYSRINYLAPPPPRVKIKNKTRTLLNTNMRLEKKYE